MVTPVSTVVNEAPGIVVAVTTAPCVSVPVAIPPVSFDEFRRWLKSALIRDNAVVAVLHDVSCESLMMVFTIELMSSKSGLDRVFSDKPYANPLPGSGGIYLIAHGHDYDFAPMQIKAVGRVFKTL